MNFDYILRNGQFYNSITEAFFDTAAVRNGEFVFVGDEKDLPAYDTQNTEIIDLDGKLVLPGLLDGHTHPETIAKSRWKLIMPHMESKQQLLDYIKEYCDKHSVEEVPYLVALGYPTTMFDDKGPRKELLDESVSDRPVRIQDYTDHACWYNSKALELMGITNNSKPRETAPFFVFNEKGEPTGWCLEPIPDNNVEYPMFEKINWWPPMTVNADTLSPFLNMLKSYGVIGLLDGFTEGEDGIKSFWELDKAGELNMYYQGAYKLNKLSELDSVIATIRDWQKKYTTSHIGIHTVKLFLDQTNEVGTGAFLSPHKCDPEGNNYGQLNMSEDDLVTLLVRLNDEQLDLHVHVVGDRGFRIACNAYEKALKITADNNKNWQIYMELAHCELVAPEDIKRPAELGILINWSCHWAGGYFGTSAIEYIGLEKWKTMYDFTKMIDSGAIVTYSSDVIGQDEEYRGNPYLGMEISATRVDYIYPADESICPGNVRQPESAKLKVKDLIKGYTQNGAIPLRLDNITGTMEIGKKANLVVLDKNIFDIKPEEIHTIDPDLVMFEGRIIKQKQR